MINIYIGWDKREQDAYSACVKSIRHNSSGPVSIYPLIQNELILRKLYWRNKPSERPSTEFSFTRFLVPYLSKYKGWSLFCDCDFIFTKDVYQLFDHTKDVYAVMCCKHEYIPKTDIKMDGQVQIPYPRKNWSSMMLFNCEHPMTKRLTPQKVSTESAGWLHEMRWADCAIGGIPLEWNWLVGEYPKYEDGLPAAIHYTLGGPWFDNTRNCDYAEEYWKYAPQE